MPTELVRGLKAHGTCLAMTVEDGEDDLVLHLTLARKLSSSPGLTR